MSLTVLDIVSKFSSLGWSLVLLGAVVAFFSLLIFIEDTKKRSNQFFLLLSLGGADDDSGYHTRYLEEWELVFRY